MKRIISIFLTIIFPFSLIALDKKSFEFNEIWSFLVSDDPKMYKDNLPITDLAFFAASLNSRARLSGVPTIPQLKNKQVRKHLVLENLSNMAAVHFAIEETLPMRALLIEDLAKAMVNFDGLMIDFEEVARADHDSMLNFLKLLKSTFPTKILSIALPARWKQTDEWFNYKEMSQIVDRILIMSYDEHWSGSDPGPISSIEMSVKMAQFALGEVAVEKLIMGLPFYGRVWGNENPAHAYRFSYMEELRKNNSAKIQTTNEGIPYFSFKRTISYIGYYENAESIRAKLEKYQDLKVKNIGFWRLGQEDPEVWNLFK